MSTYMVKGSWWLFPKYYRIRHWILVSNLPLKLQEPLEYKINKREIWLSNVEEAVGWSNLSGSFIDNFSHTTVTPLLKVQPWPSCQQLAYKFKDLMWSIIISLFSSHSTHHPWCNSFNYFIRIIYGIYSPMSINPTNTFTIKLFSKNNPDKIKWKGLRLNLHNIKEKNWKQCVQIFRVLLNWSDKLNIQQVMFRFCPIFTFLGQSYNISLQNFTWILRK